jgi:hypothetical protein
MPKSPKHQQQHPARRRTGASRRPARVALTGPLAGALAGALLLAGCGGSGARSDPTSTPTPESAPRATTSPPSQGGASDPSTPPSSGGSPAGSSRLTGSLLTADVLVSSTKPLPAGMVAGIRSVHGVAAAMPLSLASMSVNGRTLTVAAVDPAQYRRFTPSETAEADAVWSRVAEGEVAVDVQVPRKLVGRHDRLRLGTSATDPVVHVGAFAPLTKSFQAVVDTRRGRQVGMPTSNALLVSTGAFTPSALTAKLEKVIDGRANMTILALELDVHAVQTAVLTGGSVASAVGAFSYLPRPDGTINQDPAWVSTYIRTETVPLLGEVTCNKALFPQLRAALGEVVRSGLAGEIHRDQYGGCYVPRFINHDPADGLSLHSWGIAVDLNVPENQRGTAGHMDPRIVAIFQRWGFAWGGLWRFTDPMHFEMNRVVHPG